jgi:DNA repair protein RadC
MKYVDLPKHDQPAHRLQELGPRTLTTSELLAVAMFISDADTAGELGSLVSEFGSLGRIPRERITSIRNLGSGYANALQAIWELGRREQLAERPQNPSIHTPADAAALVMYEMSALDQEELRVVMLDTRNRLIRVHTVYRGSLNSTQVRVGEVFKEAVRCNAASIIVIHNHPSGDPTPSPDDVSITRAIVQSGKLLDIEVLDHLVVGANRFVSLKERGLGF